MDPPTHHCSFRGTYVRCLPVCVQQVEHCVHGVPTQSRVAHGPKIAPTLTEFRVWVVIRVMRKSDVTFRNHWFLIFFFHIFRHNLRTTNLRILLTPDERSVTRRISLNINICVFFADYNRLRWQRRRISKGELYRRNLSSSYNLRHSFKISGIVARF